MMEKSEYCDSLMGRLYNATKAGDIAMVQEIFGDKCGKELDDSYTQQVVSAAITFHQSDIVGDLVKRLRKESIFPILLQACLPHRRTLAHVLAYNDVDCSVSRLLSPLLEVDEKKALLSARDEHGWTPLHIHVASTVFKTTALLELFLEGFDTDTKLSILKQKTNKGETAVHLAARHNTNHRVIETLMNERCHHSLIGLQNYEGQTAIHLAAVHNDNSAVIDILLAGLKNSDEIMSMMKMCDSHQWSPVHLAARYNGNAVVIGTMLGLLSISRQMELLCMRTPDGSSALHLAMQYNNCSVIEIMTRDLDQQNLKSLIYARNNEKRTPLEMNEKVTDFTSKICCLLRMFQTNEKMLALKVSNSDLITPVHWAASHNLLLMQTMLELLNVEQRVEILRMQSKSGKTPLELAILYSSSINQTLGVIEIISQLIGEKIAYILMVRDPERDSTILHRVVNLMDCPSLIQSFIRALSPSATFTLLCTVDSRGYTPLHVAVTYNNLDAVLALLTPLHDKQKATLLKYRTKEMQTALHLASQQKNLFRKLLAAIPNFDKHACLSLADCRGFTPVHIVARFCHDFETVKTMLEHLNPDDLVESMRQRTHEQETPLHLAAEFMDDPRTISLLLDNIPLLTCLELLSLTNSRDFTVIHVAALNPHEEVLQEILAKFDIDGKQNVIQMVENEERLTPIHVAAQYNNNDRIIHVLMEPLSEEQRTCILRLPSKKVQTPLHLACKHNENIKVPQALLHYIRVPSEQVDILCITNDDGLTAIDIAGANHKEPDALLCFMKAVLCMPGNTQNNFYGRLSSEDGWIPIHYAARYNDSVAVMEFLCDRFSLNCRTNDGWAPIHLLARYNRSPDVLRCMLAELRKNGPLTEVLGGDTITFSMVPSDDKCVMPPVHLMAKFNKGFMMRALLGSLNTNERLDLLYKRDKDGKSPLHLAAQENEDEDVVVTMLEGLPKEKVTSLLSIENSEGLTPPQLAAKHNTNPAVVEAFLSRLDVDERQDYLKQGVTGCGTVLHLAVKNNRNPAVLKTMLKLDEGASALELLRLTDSNDRTVLELAVFHNSMEYHMEELIMKSVSPRSVINLLKYKNSQGMTAVHLAASRNDGPTLSRLFSYVDIQSRMDLLQTKTVKDWSPLHYAAQCENANSVDAMLLSLNSDQRKCLLGATTSNGWTPFHFAAQNNSSDVLNTLLNALLSDDKVEMLCMKTDENLTPVHLAFSNGNAHTLKTLKPGVLLPLIITAKDSRNVSRNGQIVIWLDTLSFTDAAYLGSLKDYLRASDTAQLSKDSELTHIYPVLDKLSSIVERQHHVTLWEDSSGNNLLHIAAMANHSDFIMRLIQTQDMREVNRALMKKNSYGFTPYHCSYRKQVPKLLAWTEKQKEAYPLLQPPRVLIFYSDVERPGSDKELESFMEALPTICVCEPVLTRNPTAQQIFQTIRENQQGEVSALAVLIMSHGNSGTVKVHDGSLALKDIVMQMNSSKLKGIPKILILQACQTTGAALQHNLDGSSNIGASHYQQQLIHDGQEFNSVPGHFSDALPGNMAKKVSKSTTRGGAAAKNDLPTHFDVQGPDMIVLAATINNQLASRNVMIPLLAHNIIESSTDADIHDIFLKTTDEVRREVPTQVPEYRSTTRLKVCLKQVYRPDVNYKSDVKLNLRQRISKVLNR